MTVKDLQIGSPVYRISLQSIDIARVRLTERFEDGTRTIELKMPYGKVRCLAKEDATEMHDTTDKVWYINVEDAELAQLMRRSEHVEKLKKAMENAQNQLANAIELYAFAEPSTPKEL